jgi:ribosome-binding ATPase YchF (GTP1/OBG family)
VLYVCNVEEESAAEGNAFSARVFEKARAEGANAVIVSAAIEASWWAWMPRSAWCSSKKWASTKPASPA